jgi:long-chain acyl-CoA synthetase
MMAEMAEKTLPQFLLRNARQWPRDVAMREKEKGIWQQWTWEQYLD